METLLTSESISDSSSSETGMECYICRDHLTDPYTLECSHQACKSCLTGSIRNSVTEGRCPVPCFMPGCTKRISANECGTLLADDLDQFLNKIASLEEIAQIPENSRGSCPACRKVYDKYEYSQSHSSNCRRCGFLFCAW